MLHVLYVELNQLCCLNVEKMPVSIILKQHELFTKT